MEINGRLESDYREIRNAYYKKENNRTEAFLKDLYDSIKALEAIGNEYVKTNENPNKFYILEKIEFAKARWDAAYEYFKNIFTDEELSTEENFRIYAKYERVRRSSKYNMFDAAAQRDSNLSNDQYIFAMNKYTQLHALFNERYDEENK